MEIGDSFGVDSPTKIRTAISVYYAKTETIKKFTVRKHEGGYRCWRLEGIKNLNRNPQRSWTG